MAWVLAEGLLTDALLKGAGGAAFSIVNSETWRWWHYPAWLSIILVAFRVLETLVHLLGRASTSARIRARGKHLDEFEPTDTAFVLFNRCCTAVFNYHGIRYLWYSPWGGRITWDMSELGIASGLGAFVALYMVYDLFYTAFHRVLHVRGLYKHVHKHHHRQKAPSRGNADAVNVHPFEFVCGEYLHILALHLVSKFVVPVHVVAAGTFVIAGGILASLNHTRFDVRIPFLYEVRYHDIHHWYPDSNYGQYTMLWDYMMGSLKHYPSDKDGGKENGGAGILTSNAAVAGNAAAENKEKAG